MAHVLVEGTVSHGEMNHNQGCFPEEVTLKVTNRRWSAMDWEKRMTFISEDVRSFGRKDKS